MALVATIAVVLGVVARDSQADLDNFLFTSRADRLRLVVPRGWRASDQPSYPGLLLWMAHASPVASIQLTAETFTRDLYCTWPVACQTSHDSLPAKYACALRKKLEAQRMRVGPVQAGPRENEDAGLPSVWFEYDDGKHFLRHAIAFSSERAVSLVLSAPNPEARATHSRAFEQALRTMRLLSEEETTRIEGIDAGLPFDIAPPGDGPIDATAPIDAAVLDAGVTFESAPAPRINPIGPCRK